MRKNITIVMSDEERKLFKKYAIDHDTTMSELVVAWLREHLAGS